MEKLLFIHSVVKELNPFLSEHDSFIDCHFDKGSVVLYIKEFISRALAKGANCISVIRYTKRISTKLQIHKIHLSNNRQSHDIE